jgi:hypothetical protein
MASTVSGRPGFCPDDERHQPDEHPAAPLPNVDAPSLWRPMSACAQRWLKQGGRNPARLLLCTG